MFLFQENNTIKNIILFNDSGALFLGKAGEKAEASGGGSIGMPLSMLLTSGALSYPKNRCKEGDLAGAVFLFL